MKYLVSIENTPYYKWQIDLLVKSFQNKNLLDDLIVASVDEVIYDLPCQTISYSGISKIYANASPHLNRLLAVIEALKKGLLESRFAVIEPDMIVVEPLPAVEENVSFSTDLLSTPENFAETNVSEHIDKVKERRKIKEYKWPYLGGVMQFKDVPIDFFQRVIDWGVSMPNSRYTEKAALTITFLEYVGKIAFKSRDYESTLLDHNLKNFIHYSRGMPPVFNKRNFLSQDVIMASSTNPIDVLREYNATPAVDYMLKISDIK